MLLNLVFPKTNIIVLVKNFLDSSLRDTLKLFQLKIFALILTPDMSLL